MLNAGSSSSNTQIIIALKVSRLKSLMRFEYNSLNYLKSVIIMKMSLRPTLSFIYCQSMSNLKFDLIQYKIINIIDDHRNIAQLGDT